MKERCFGSSTMMIVFTPASAACSDLPSWRMAARVVRCVEPTSSSSRLATSTSPPSMVGVPPALSVKSAQKRCPRSALW